MSRHLAKVLLLVALHPACGGGGGGGGGSSVPLGGGPVPPVVWDGKVPAGLPTHLAVGLGNFDESWPNTSGVGWEYRSQYLSGGVNTGSGWYTWNAQPDDFAYRYMTASGTMIPVFDYYQFVGSFPNQWNENPDPKLKNTATMNAYFLDFKRLMLSCARYNQTVIVHVEPDFWGFCQSTHGDDPSVIPVAVAASGFADVAGFPNNLPGFAQALVHLRNLYAGKVLIALHASHWGTGADLIVNSANPDTVGQRTADFFNALGADFELMFHDPSDRDSAWKVANGSSVANAWWDDADFTRYEQYLTKVWTATGRRGILWQVPIGNTIMKACNQNVPYHYQDNRAEYWFNSGVPASDHRTNYANAGVIAIIFGNPQTGTTSYSDADPTLPKPKIDNPGGVSGLDATVPDDDGGFLRSSVGAYYAGGTTGVPLP